MDWWQWGDDAFAEAKRRDVPVLISVGYASATRVGGSVSSSYSWTLIAYTGVMPAHRVEVSVGPDSLFKAELGLIHAFVPYRVVIHACADGFHVPVAVSSSIGSKIWPARITAVS